MPPAIPCELISWNRFCALARRLALKVRASGFQPDIIVAIERGGYMPARILSDLLGVTNLAGLRIEHYRGTHKEPMAVVRYPLSAEVSGQRVLLVDDVNDTGDTFKVALDHLHSRASPGAIRTAALHHKVVSSFVPDLYAVKVTQWRWIIYPWAVTEDLKVLIRALEPRPDTAEGIARELEHKHGIRMRQQAIVDALTLQPSIPVKGSRALSG
jgi:hypoxanthine phosphoribosyltransferase